MSVPNIIPFNPNSVLGCAAWFDFSDTNSITKITGTIGNNNTFSAWSLNNVTIVDNAVTAPDGNATAASYTTTNTTSSISTPFIGISTTATMAKLSISVFAKYSNRQYLVIQTRGLAGSRTYFDIQNGTVGTVGGNHSGATISSYGNGWYLCTTNCISDAGTPSFNILLSSANGTLTQASGDICFLWQANAIQTRISSILNKVSQVAWTQGTTQSQPGFSIDSGALPYAVFNGGQNINSTEASVVSALSNDNANTIFVAVKANTVTGIQVYLLSSAPTAARPYKIYFQNTTKYSFETIDNTGGADQLKETATSIATTANRILEFVDGSGTIDIYTEGTNRLSTTYVTGTKTPTTITIGANNLATLSSFLVANLREIIVYNRVLTADERNIVRKYLGQKYSVVVV